MGEMRSKEILLLYFVNTVKIPNNKDIFSLKINYLKVKIEETHHIECTATLGETTKVSYKGWQSLTYTKIMDNPAESVMSLLC
jgi:hypothetical protein